MPTTPNQHSRISTRTGIIALSPMAVFMIFLCISLILGDTLSVPLGIAFIVASAWGLALLKGRSLMERIEVFSKSAARSDVLYMIWIFILAGAFASLATHVGAVSATVDLALRFLPASMIVPGLFAAACFISMAIGTSVGTVVALTPIAAELSASSPDTGSSLPFMVAVIVGGAFFGDNLSFISDTTIAATRTQGCKMNEKFRANICIVLPAALITLVAYIFIGTNAPSVAASHDVNYWLVLPYLLVIGTALCGINVTIVLACGIISTLIIGLTTGFGIGEMLTSLGSGINSVGELVIVTLLAAGMLGLIKELGGIDWLMQVMTRHIRGSRGAQFCIASLVSLVNLCTANNTVAILTVGDMSRSISQRFGVTPRKTASLLDTCSCIVQCLIPYGAQVLLAASIAKLSPTSLLPYMYYAWALILATIISIIIRRRAPQPQF